MMTEIRQSQKGARPLSSANKGEETKETEREDKKSNSSFDSDEL
jgi:hypothetical protein